MSERDFGKWPRLLVVGESITPGQADEILIRTNEWDYLATNDVAWRKEVYNIAGIDSPEPDCIVPDRKSWKRFQKAYKVLDLLYLYNSRIVSSWIGGPHGWCNWDGTIHTTNYNIGKWPFDVDVTDDWVKIAEAFPYLNLRAQLVGDEGEDSVPAMSWAIHDGRVFEVRSKELIATPTEPDLKKLGQHHGERGVSAVRLTAALKTTHNRLHKKER
jgi:hypothetical protein